MGKKINKKIKGQKEKIKGKAQERGFLNRRR